MATGKKFYWLKLKKDFMMGDIVDFLMGQRNGAQYVVLYQMLCLMCINTSGTLSRQIGEMIIPFDTDKIYRDCKYFSRDTIVLALGMFKKLGLIYEQDEGVLAITGFDNLVGYETDYAIQKRNQRQIPFGGVEGLADSSADGAEDNNVDSPADSSIDNSMDNSMDIYVDNVVDSSMDNGADNVVDSSMDKGVDNVHTEKEIEKEIRDKRLEKDKDNITVSDETVRQTDVRRVMNAWNGLQCYGIKPVSRISRESKRYKSLKARIREYGVGNVLEAVSRIKQSEFLQGKNKSGWAITFDWFVLPNNFPKVLEGNYDSQAKNGQKRTVFNEWEDA